MEEKNQEEKIKFVRARGKPCESCRCRISIHWFEICWEGLPGEEIIHEINFCKVCETCGKVTITSHSLGMLHSVN